MKACYIDIHIHTSEDANNVNEEYDVKKLKKKISEYAKDNNYLISLTDHNTINYYAYEKMIEEKMNFIVGVELHVKNYENCPAYHCHFFFKTRKEDTLIKIKKINEKLDKLYPNKLPELCDPSIPNLSQLIKTFEGYDYLILPHGGQSHCTFDKSIPSDGVCFNDVMERSVYYNLFDGFTARSNTKLEKTQKYFQDLGISEFISLVTCTDNYSVDNYPSCKSDVEFVPTWMYSTASFDGLRVALSEKSRFSYGCEPINNWQEYIKKVSLEEDNIVIDVDLEPGLNVVIGNSSSGKTLFVDSLSKKINDKENTTYAKYNVKNIIIDNPSNIIPHYFHQNYILSLVKSDEEKGIDNNLCDNEFLKHIFPFDREFEEKIENSIKSLQEQLTIFVNSAKNISDYRTKISNIGNFSRLFYIGDKLSNPAKTFLPSSDEKARLEITEEDKKKVDSYLESIKAFKDRIAFCDSIDNEIKSIKSKLESAYNEIDYANIINNVIDNEANRVELELKETNQKNVIIDGNKKNLLEYIRNLVLNYNSFNESYNKIISFSVSVETKTIKSAGHSLLIRNDFKITKDLLIETINKFIRDKISGDNISFDKIIDENFSKKNPKVADYDDFIGRIMNEFKNKNKVVYEITHKDGRKFSELSPGLRTSVILDIILGYDKDQAPLIIDQPEDNLATNYINTDLVAAIKKSKSKRQIIIVTHNATIPMLGDAQNIIYCKNTGGIITIKSYKMEDDYNEKQTVLDIIADVTDGGKASVKKRFKKYNLKNYR